MPVSAASSAAVYEAVRAAGVRLIATLPENWLGEVIRLAEADPAMQVVRVAREEEGVGIVAGAHLAGMRAALILQCHGLFQSVNGIISLAMLYRIPLLLLVSDRGYLGERDPWQTEGGRHTRRVLDALGIVHEDVSDPARAAEQVQRAATLAEASLFPVALLLTRPLLWEDAL